MGESRSPRRKIPLEKPQGWRASLALRFAGGLRHRTRDPHFHRTVIGRIESEDQGGRALLGRTQTQTGV